MGVAVSVGGDSVGKRVSVSRTIGSGVWVSTPWPAGFSAARVGHNQAIKIQSVTRITIPEMALFDWFDMTR